MSVVRYVNPDSNGGNGTTSALSGANAAYASLSAAEAEWGVLSDWWDIVCDTTNGTADGSSVTISGATTTAANYINIRSSAASRHDGKWNTTKYRLERTTDSANLVTVVVPWVRMIGLQFHLTTTAASYKALIQLSDVGDATEVTIDSCILYLSSSGTSANMYGIRSMYVASGTRTAHIRNSVFQDVINGATTSFTALNVQGGWTFNVDNCTAYNCYAAFTRSSGTGNWRNCGAAVCTTGFSGGTQTTCSTSTPTFVSTAGTYDLHLQSGDTTWKDQGTDLSATFTTDIDGQTRPTGAGTWDIGADEYVVSYVPYPFSRGSRGGAMALSGGMQ